MGSLNTRYVFLTVLEAAKSNIKAPTNVVSSENPLPGGRLLTSHHALTRWEEARMLSVVLYVRALISFMRALPHALPPNTISFGE